jgi:hypothetical protein
MTEDQTHGFELPNDGIHRSFISVDAIESLTEVSVGSDEDKQILLHGRFPILWHWVYNPSLGRHFPTCMLCNKRMCDAHLFPKDHVIKYRSPVRACSGATVNPCCENHSSKAGLIHGRYLWSRLNVLVSLMLSAENHDGEPLSYRRGVPTDDRGDVAAHG